MHYRILSIIFSVSISISHGADINSCLPGLEGREVVPAQLYDINRAFLVSEAPSLEDGGFNYAKNHWGDRPEGDLGAIQVLVMHYTVGNAKSTFATFCQSPCEVSAHYVVTETETDNNVAGGTVVRVVPEEKRAWHAGVSQWRDIECDTKAGKSRGLNSASIGIENVNKGFAQNEDGTLRWYPFDADQIHSLGLLSKGIVAKHNIAPYNVVGHSDIAIGVKSDPGVLFPWGHLYEVYGVGAWLTAQELSGGLDTSTQKEPLPQGVSEAYFLNACRMYGYTSIPEGVAVITPELERELRAFRLHFSANQNEGLLGGSLRQADMLWAHGLVTKYGRN